LLFFDVYFVSCGIQEPIDLNLQVNPLGLKLLIKFTPRGITSDNYAPTACSAAC